MNIIELFLTSVSLAMDAFAVSICKGLNTKKINVGIKIIMFFSFFQTIMPILGYYIGIAFSEKIINYNPFISSTLLITIGLLMFKENDNPDFNNSICFFELIVLSIATSIDALVVGISFAFNKTNIIFSSSIIGITTFILCSIGFFLGHLFNKKLSLFSNKLGGITLIIIGIKNILNIFI